MRNRDKYTNSKKQHTPATCNITQAPHAYDGYGDNQQVRDDDPLYELKRRIKRRRESWQGDVCDAGTQGGKEHGQG